MCELRDEIAGIAELLFTSRAIRVVVGAGSRFKLWPGRWLPRALLPPSPSPPRFFLLAPSGSFVSDLASRPSLDMRHVRLSLPDWKWGTPRARLVSPRFGRVENTRLCVESEKIHWRDQGMLYVFFEGKKYLIVLHQVRTTTICSSI